MKTKKVKITKDDLLKEENRELLLTFGSEFLRNLARIGIDIISVSDMELKKVINTMIVGNLSEKEIMKLREKQRKALKAANKRKSKKK